MAITLAAFSGTQTVSTTEWSLTGASSGPLANTIPGVYQAFVDLSAVAAGDEFQFAIYEKVLNSGATQRQLFKVTLANAQSASGFVSLSIILGVGWDMTLLKIAGTDRSLTWRISKGS